MPSAPLDPPPGSRPLIVRVRNWVGEVALGWPVLAAAAQAGYAPQVVARGRWAAALLAGSGFAVHVQPRGLRARVAQLRALRQACRAADPGFDRRENMLLQTDSFSSALEARLAGLRAVGYAGEGRSWLLARALPMDRRGHVAGVYWRLGCGLLGRDAPVPAALGLPVSPALAAQARQRLAQAGIVPAVDGGRGYLLICPFAATPVADRQGRKRDKKWPGFADFCARAQAELGLPLLVCPGPGAETDEARQRLPQALVLTDVDLGLYAALLQAASAVVANDTGPGHLAAAVGAPLVSVLGPTVAEAWAPWGPQVHRLQRPQPETGEAVWPGVDAVLQATRAALAGAGHPADDRARHG